MILYLLIGLAYAAYFCITGGVMFRRMIAQDWQVGLFIPIVTLLFWPLFLLAEVVYKVRGR